MVECKTVNVKLNLDKFFEILHIQIPFIYPAENIIETI